MEKEMISLRTALCFSALSVVASGSAALQGHELLGREPSSTRQVEQSNARENALVTSPTLLQATTERRKLESEREQRTGDAHAE
jgi:hypothetical protein